MIAIHESKNVELVAYHPADGVPYDTRGYSPRAPLQMIAP